MKTGLFFIPLAGLLLANAAQAAICQNVSGAYYRSITISTTSAAQKRGGNTVQLTKTGSERSGRVPQGPAFSNRTYRSYMFHPTPWLPKPAAHGSI